MVDDAGVVFSHYIFVFVAAFKIKGLANPLGMIMSDSPTPL